jgi:hypothetical protein
MGRGCECCAGCWSLMAYVMVGGLVGLRLAASSTAGDLRSGELSPAAVFSIYACASPKTSVPSQRAPLFSRVFLCNLCPICDILTRHSFLSSKGPQNVRLRG